MNDGMPRVVIVGGGVAALETLIGLHKMASELVELDLLCPQSDFIYRPLSVTEPFELGVTPRFDLGRIATEHGARHLCERLERVDTHGERLLTESGEEIPYDALVIAIGARAQPAVEGALTFTGARERDQLVALLDELERGEVRDVAFVVPFGVVWPLPAYELALMTAERLDRHGVPDVQLSLVTSEQSPLRLFGRRASERVEALLGRRGIELRTSTHIAQRDGDSLVLAMDGRVSAQRVVAMPTLSGLRIEGLAQDQNGFLRTDGFGLVDDAPNVYAAGDITSFPVKQGGIATQQADSIASSLAARFGADVEPRPFRPVLRGLLLSDDGPNYLRAEIAGGAGDDSEVSCDPLWRPAGKIMGRYLSPYLAGLGVTPAGHPGRS